jgi:hypothetical protein
MSTADEETPLLRPEQIKKQPSPLPWGQFSIILFLQLAEPLTSQVIYPFAPAVCISHLFNWPTITYDRLTYKYLAAHSRSWCHQRG